MTKEEVINILKYELSQISDDERHPNLLQHKDFCKTVLEILQDRPTGHWIYHKADGYFLPKMECSVCGAIDCLLDTTPKRFKEIHTYCPNCGAEMNP